MHNVELFSESLQIFSMHSAKSLRLFSVEIMVIRVFQRHTESYKGRSHQNEQEQSRMSQNDTECMSYCFSGQPEISSKL